MSESQLHEILAVEKGVKSTAETITKEAIHTFTRKQTHFDGHVKTYKPINEEDSDVFPPDVKELVTTVPAKLSYIEDAIVRAVDVMYQKEQTNTSAKADIVLDNGDVIAENVPATVLLNLETKIKQIRDVFGAALTLDPTKKWQKSATDDNVWETEATETVRTKKVEEPLVLYPATPEHPAQTKSISVDKTVGKWESKFQSGAISPKEKSKLLGRIDTLMRAIQRARQRANKEKIQVVNIGKKLFDFINDR